ncbi:MAG TPA: carboxypeptidase regulatory-like domain-containing protein [Candidatus Krumholzibacteria bacterium]|nr:carboxypeptidase regulatory-like domain-containing protein [Candidatus Krumholzibacteria bacterium]
MTKRVFLAALLLVLITSAAGAAVLRGVTRDVETGQPVGFVTVQVLGRSVAGEDIAQGVMSLDDGRYVFGLVPNGRYLVRFSRVGYTVMEDSLVIAEDREYTLDATLVVQPVAVEKIVVEEDRYSRIGAVQPGFVSIKADELSALPGIAEGDPVRSLQLLPGVQAASDFSSALYVRGGGPDQTLVLLDQATVYNPTHAFGFFSTFNPDAAGDVNLYKGAYPADLGGRLGAVLDVRSREANARTVNGKVGVTTIASRLALSGPLGGASWSLSGRRTHLEPLLNAIRDEDTEVPDYYFYDINGKLSVPAAGGRLDFSAYTGSDQLDFFLGTGTDLTLDWGNTVASAAFVRAFGDRLLTTTRVSLSKYGSNTAASAFTTPITIKNDITDVTAAGELAWQANLRHTLTAGLQATTYDVGFKQDFNQESLIDYRRKPLEAAGFLSDRWTPWAETVVDAGARIRYIDDGERWLAEPRAGIAQTLTPTVRLKLAGGIYHQYMQLVATEAVSAADFYVPIDPTADIGRSWQMVAGVDWRWRPSTLFSVEGYYTGLDHLVSLDGTTAANATIETADDLFYLNGSGYATGVELFARRDIGAVTGWIGYTLGWTRREFPELNNGKTFPPKYDRRHDISAVGEYRRGKWRFSGAFVYATGQAFTPIASRYTLRDPGSGVTPSDIHLIQGDRNSARLLPYNRLDVSVARNFSLFGARAEWLVEVFNLYSRRNEWFVQYDRTGEVVDVTVARMLPIIPSIGVNVWF